MKEQLNTLLPSLSTSYSVRYKVDFANQKGKRNAKYNCIRQPWSDADLVAHFGGSNAISLQPLLDDGNTAQWGAIDVDAYGQENLAAELKKKLNLLGFPCFVEPSKSLGAHIYFLLDRPVIAKPFRQALKKIAGWIGHPEAEIRPASDEIKTAEGDVGVMMVAPGFGVAFEEVLPRLQAAVQSVESFNKLTEEGDFIDGPPCLFPLQRQYQVEGWTNRNLYMYQLAVFFRYKYPGDWQQKVREYYETFIDPPLEEGIEPLIASLEKNTKCHYKCKEAMFESTCNKVLCGQRRFGVSVKDGAHTLLSEEGITILGTDPPTWFITLNHPKSGETKRVRLSTVQLMTVRLFKQRILEELQIVPTLPKQQDWETALQGMVDKAVYLQVPFEMTEKARLLDLVFKYGLSAIKTEDKEGLIYGRMYVLKEEGEEDLWGCFRLMDFANYIDKVKYRGITTADLYATFTELAELGKLKKRRIDIPPLQVETWSMKMDSTYMRMKAEIDLE